MDQNFNSVAHYILIVDDDPDDHYLLRRAITQHIPQAIVESLYDGAEALAYLQTCTSLPNLIFLDLNMVKISGKDTIRLIKANPILSKVPVVVLTTSRNSEERESLISMGAAAFYTKPHSSLELNTIVQETKRQFLEIFV